MLDKTAMSKNSAYDSDFVAILAHALLPLMSEAIRENERLSALTTPPTKTLPH